MSRVALVTGGSRGIGAAISKELKDAGYTVAATYAGNDEAARRQEGPRHALHRRRHGRRNVPGALNASAG